MTLTEEQLKAIALLLVASDRTKVGNFDLEDEQKARTILGAMIDSSGTIDYESLRCESCGKTLTEIRGSKYAGDYCMGEIRLDPGQEASMSDPPIEPSYYFWCDECSEHIREPPKMIGFEAEWTSDLEVLDRGTRSGLIDIEIAKKWHAAYRKAQNSNMLRKQENERLRADAEQSERVVEARIRELAGMLDARSREIVGRIQECQACQIDQLQAEGKIGPDAKPRSWQITDERKATLSASLKVLERLKKNNTDTDHSYLDRGITVLRVMLEEAL